MSPYLLIIEPDSLLRVAMSGFLRGQGFEVKEESTCGGGLARLMEQQPGAIIMAEDVPPINGAEVLPLLRRLTRAAIIVIGEGGEAAVVSALSHGADVYLKKPVNFREMLSRIRAALRRAESQPDINFFRNLPPVTVSELICIVLMLRKHSAGGRLRERAGNGWLWGPPCPREELRPALASASGGW